MEEQKQIEYETVEPKVWKDYKEDDSIAGVLIAKKENVGPNNSMAYYIENADGQTMVWGATILDNLMLCVEIGTNVRITYIGMKKNKNDQDTKHFQVEKAKT